MRDLNVRYKSNVFSESSSALFVEARTEIMKPLVFPMTTQFASTVSQETYTCFLFNDKIYQDVFLLTNASSLVSLDLGTLRLAHGRKGNPQQSRGLHVYNCI
jgi:hypothetical protein